ncbi:MAG: lamin tail domain-containing protein [Myxococcales bacterium]
MVELLINPAGTDTGREWVELLNRSTHTLSLAGLHLSDASNDAAVEFGAAAAPLLAAGQRSVLVQSRDPTKNGGIVLGPGLAGGTFGTLVSLNNEADSISLCDGPCASGAVLDRVTWDSSLGPGYDGHALVIDSSNKRCPATQPFGDAASFGTPGTPNPPCP